MIDLFQTDRHSGGAGGDDAPFSDDGAKARRRFGLLVALGVGLLFAVPILLKALGLLPERIL